MELFGRLASKHVTSLNNIRKLYIADSGAPGEANFKKGTSAEHSIIPVSMKQTISIDFVVPTLFARCLSEP